MPSTKRQRELARRRAERQAVRRAELRRQRRRRNLILYTSTFAVVLLIVVGVFVLPKIFDDDAKPSANPTASPSATGGRCAYTPNTAEKPDPAPGLPEPPDFGAAKRLHATVRFDSGVVLFDLFADQAPCTANSFEFLASKLFFDNTPCHRATNSATLTVLQCGDPTGTGSGGPGYGYIDENLPSAGPDASASYPKGTIAMANSGKATNGSQFFLVVKDSKLPPNYTILGRITKGLDVLERILAQGITPPEDGAPNKPVKIQRLRITR